MQVPQLREPETVEPTLAQNLTALEELRTSVRHCGPVEIRNEHGRVGFLETVLSERRLLLVHAPHVRCGVLLIPFEAVERVDRDGREILLRPAREALEVAAGSCGRHVGC